MSPLEIEILLHYYYCPGDYQDGDFSAPAAESNRGGGWRAWAEDAPVGRVR